MNIKPLGDRVLVELVEEQPDAGTIIAAPTANKEGFQPLECGVVRAVGTRCKLEIKEGDVVGVFTNHGRELPGTSAKLYFSQHVIIKKEVHA